MSNSNTKTTSKKALSFRNLGALLEKWASELMAEPSLEAVKSKLKQFRDEFEWEVDYSGPTSKQTGHRKYDVVIESIFNATSCAIPKEQLLAQFLDELSAPELNSQAVCMLVIEAESIDEKNLHYQYRGILQRKVQQPSLWTNFNKTELPKHNASVLFRKILLENKEYSLLHSDFLEEYNGEFNCFMGKLNKGSPNKDKNKYRPFWINALPLPATNQRYPERALIILYAAKAIDSYRYLPPGANQEWRCLHFLGIAYQHLEHQVRNAAEMIYQDRNTLLTSLAPGLLHHEIGHQTQAITNITLLQRQATLRLLKKDQSKDLERLAYQIHLLETAGTRLYEITDAFNNMEKQSTGEAFTLEKVLKNTKNLCFHRLGNSAVNLSWNEKCQSIKLFSDPPLLLHLLVNLVTNAIIAFEHEEDQKNYGSLGRNIVVKANIEELNKQKQLILRVENNGPPIIATNQPRVFEKGFTSYRDGHGQGLYICRLISQYLGGSLNLLSKQELSRNMQVGFKLSVLLKIPKRQDLSRNK